jgi:hypothetical protein
MRASISRPFSLPSCIPPYSHHIIPQFSLSHGVEACADPRFVIAEQMPSLPALRALSRSEDTRQERSLAAPRCVVPTTSRGACERYGESSYDHDCPAYHGSSSTATGPSRWSVGRVLIPNMSAWKKAVRKGRSERERAKVIPPLCNPSTLPFADIGFTARPLFSALRAPKAC